MQIEQLRLERYGVFREKVIDLSGAHLHVIAGPNGIGKSTIRAAFSDLLFGFPHISPWAIGFEQNQLRLGAVIKNRAGAALDFTRLKGRRATLVGPDGASLDEQVLQAYLSGIDRNTFETLYALDAERLRKGGEEMLRAKSDLGQTIFAAASGLATLSDVRDALKSQLDEIGSLHRSAEKPVWKAEQEFGDAIQRAQGAALRMDEWNAAHQELSEAGGSLQRLNDRRREIELERVRLDRELRVFPIIAELDRLGSQLESLSDVPELPADFGDRWRKAVDKWDRAKESVDEASAAHARREKERAALAPAAGRIIDFATDVETLYRQVGNIRDLLQAEVKLDRDIASETERLKSLSAALGSKPEDVERLAASIPRSAEVARVRSLIVEETGLRAELTAAKKAKKDAEEALEHDKSELDAIGEARDPAEAMTVWGAARSVQADHRKVQEDDRRVTRALETEQSQFARLGHWLGTVEALATAAFPSAEAVQAAKDKLDRSTRAEEDAEKKVAELEADLEDAKGKIEDARAGGSVPTADDIREARALRDRAWAPIRETPTAGTAPSLEALARYESLVREADDVADRRMAGAEILAQQRQLETAQLRIEKRLEKARDNLSKASRQRQADEESARKLWAGTGYDGDVDPPDVMLGWLGRKEKVLEVAAHRRAAEDDRKAAMSAFDRAWGHLQRVASLLGVTIDSSEDVEVAEERVSAAVNQANELWTKRGQLGVTVARREKELKRHKASAEEADKALKAWRVKWRAEMPALNLGDDATPAEATAVLDAWDGFAQEARNRAESSRRLKGVRTDLDKQRQRVDAIVEKLMAESEVASTDVEEWHDWPDFLYRKLQSANALAGRIATADQRVSEAADALASAREAEKSAEATCSRLRAERHLEGVEEVSGAIERSDRVRLLKSDVGAKQTELAEAGEGRSEEQLRSELAGATREDIQTARSQSDENFGQVTAEIEEAIRLQVGLQRNLHDLEQRTGFTTASHAANSHAARVGELAQRWMRLTTAMALLDGAIERYRQANEGPLIKRADEIFITIAGRQSPDDFHKLDVDYQKPNDPRLIAIRGSDVACRVEAMSEGTRDQLWLALRIAALELRARDAEAMPFLADDLFASSDAVRAGAGVRYLAELARHTQVILFTHHDYVVDAVRNAVPEARVHELTRERIAA